MNVIESIYKEPEKWKATTHHLEHEDGTQLWTANGVFFCQPETMSFSLWNKWKAWRAFRWWCINRPMDTGNGEIE